MDLRLLPVVMTATRFDDSPEESVRTGWVDAQPAHPSELADRRQLTTWLLLGDPYQKWI